jgi:hypothetical protein
MTTLPFPGVPAGRGINFVTSHGRFNGVASNEMEAAHPSPQHTAADMALNFVDAAKLTGRLTAQAQFEKSKEARISILDSHGYAAEARSCKMEIARNLSTFRTYVSTV